MENNKFFCFKLKLKGLKAEKLIACASKEDLIELILQSEDCQVEPIHSTLIEMARRKKIKNHTILTKYELKKALGLGFLEGFFGFPDFFGFFRIFPDFFRFLISCSNFGLKKINFLFLYFLKFLFFIFIFLFFLFLFFDFSAKFSTKKIVPISEISQGQCPRTGIFLLLFLNFCACKNFSISTSSLLVASSAGLKIASVCLFSLPAFSFRTTGSSI